jgi:hypothetical protein
MKGLNGIYKKGILIIGITLLVSFFVSTAFAEVPVKDYEKMKSTDMMKVYVRGLGNGMVTVNSLVKHTLFCQPSKLALTLDNLIQILDKEIERFEERYGSQATQKFPIEILMLYGLQNTFPCDEAISKKSAQSATPDQEKIYEKLAKELAEIIKQTEGMSPKEREEFYDRLQKKFNKYVDDYYNIKN